MQAVGLCSVFFEAISLTGAMRSEIHIGAGQFDQHWGEGLLQ